jgi:glucose-1-phosphate thymidylyltransferase
MRGVILAGGFGSRLYPTTKSVNKHLIPVYDKPMIYYPLTTLILAGAKNICIVSTSQGVEGIKDLLGDGTELGIEINYKIQEQPRGITDGINVALSSFVDYEPILVILGDNIFYGPGLGRAISEAVNPSKTTIWTQGVSNPEEFGIIAIDSQGQVTSIQEKPIDSESNLAITGLYYLSDDLPELIKNIAPSARGEIEITSLLEKFHYKNDLNVKLLGRGIYWTDAGTVENLSNASQFIKLVQTRQGNLIGSPHEAAYQTGLISKAKLISVIEDMPVSDYKNSLEAYFNFTA